MTHTTKEGKVIWIADMTANHLRNTIKLIYKNQRMPYDKFMEYVREAAKRRVIDTTQYTFYSQYEVYESPAFDSHWD